ncbi:MAG: tRNA (adenosine(37)-N6)-threonylcarbamoyltransferase complex dimerization subunit type 1 TsaB [Buchnera aphidicola (Eriosoma harunire)]
MKKTILCIDTSNKICSVGLLINNCIDYISSPSILSHNEQILLMINKLMLRNFITIKSLNLIAISIGPGQFTGIRIGVCVAQGLSFYHSIPIIAFSTLEILAEQAWRIYKVKKILVIVGSKKNEVYWGQYIKNDNGLWSKHTQDQIVKNKNIAKNLSLLNSDWLHIGTKIDNVFLKNITKNILYQYITIPHPIDIINLSILSLKNKQKNSLDIMQLNYLYNQF